MPLTNGKKLPREFYTRSNVLTVARELLGKLLVVTDSSGQRVSGMIVEDAAYRGHVDRASHAYGGERENVTRAGILLEPEGQEQTYPCVAHQLYGSSDLD